MVHSMCQRDWPWDAQIQHYVWVYSWGYFWVRLTLQSRWPSSAWVSIIQPIEGLNRIKSRGRSIIIEKLEKKCPIILGSKHKLCSQINFSNYKETMGFQVSFPLCNRNIFLQGWPCRAQKQQENESKWRPQMGTRMRNNAIVIIPKSRKTLS